MPCLIVLYVLQFQSPSTSKITLEHIQIGDITFFLSFSFPSCSYLGNQTEINQFLQNSHSFSTTTNSIQVIQLSVRMTIRITSLLSPSSIRSVSVRCWFAEIPLGTRRIPLEPSQHSPSLDLDEIGRVRIRVLCDKEDEGRRDWQAQREERERGMNLHRSISI